MAGQSVCSGCGSEFMSCGVRSLLTKVTRVPALAVSVFGDTTPLELMVMVVDGSAVPPPPLPEPPPVLGADGDELPPPQPALRAAASAAERSLVIRIDIRRIASRY